MSVTRADAVRIVPGARRGAAVPAAVLILLAVLVPPPVRGGTSLLGLPPLCIFRNLTGLPCPGCGITRSVVCCAHGHWSDALRYHPLGPAVLIALVSLVAWRVCWPGYKLPPRWANAGYGAALGVTLAVWTARLAGWLPPPP